MFVIFDTFDKCLSSFVGNNMKTKSINEKTKPKDWKEPIPNDLLFHFLNIYIQLFLSFIYPYTFICMNGFLSYLNQFALV